MKDARGGLARDYAEGGAANKGTAKKSEKDCASY